VERQRNERRAERLTEKERERRDERKRERERETDGGFSLSTFSTACQGVRESTCVSFSRCPLRSRTCVYVWLCGRARSRRWPRYGVGGNLCARVHVAEYGLARSHALRTCVCVCSCARVCTCALARARARV